jgi:hypothetical protein
VVRLALNWDQVELWQPPENPAKETDSRFEKYRDEFGESSWELDAIEPRTLAELVTDEVLSRREDDLWGVAVKKEAAYIEELNQMAAKYK